MKKCRPRGRITFVIGFALFSVGFAGLSRMTSVVNVASSVEWWTDTAKWAVIGTLGTLLFARAAMLERSDTEVGHAL